MEPKLLLKSLVGSRAYNLHTEDSDFDYRYVQVSPLRSALSPFKNLDTKAKTEGNQDDAVWELAAFLKYAANGNPSVYEALYSPFTECGCPEAKPLFESLIANRSKFLDARRVFDAHRGYATAQMKKIDWDEPSMRTRKAIVAYLRVLDQGAELLAHGHVDVWLNEGIARTQLMEIKSGGPLDRMTIEAGMLAGESSIRSAFETTKLTSPDFDWIEQFNEDCYLTLGRPSEVQP